MSIALKLDVSYELENILKNKIIKVKNIIETENNKYEIYLFGSIAKGCYSKNSDIDILLLIDDEKSLKELRVLRHSIEDKIEILNLDINVDIKIYTKKRFIELSNNPSFESSITKDLINIKRW